VVDQRETPGNNNQQQADQQCPMQQADQCPKPAVAVRQEDFNAAPLNPQPERSSNAVPFDLSIYYCWFGNEKE
jgi:hypothetical protein